MARKKGTKVKTAVKKILDKTTVDEKVVAKYNEKKSLYDTIFCHIKCYGGYVVAVGAGCTFGANIWWGLGLLVASAGWAYWATHCNKSAKCKLK